MSGAAYRMAFLSDSHLGYAARCRIHPPSGLNERVRDGMLALRATVDQILADEVDVVVHGGDLFHRSWPQVGDIVWARRQIGRLVAAGIPVIGNTGNHDASAERGKSPATAAVHDPDRGVEMVTDPYRVIRPVPGLALHVISHYGLAQAERLLPEPEDGTVNVLTAHGAAMLPGHDVFRCVDSPGEQPIGLDVLTDDRFAVKVLGHYHGMDEILPGVWYAGSSLRRGFSDPPGGRGWLLVTVGTDGRVSVERRFIDQRPQHDLPLVDAAGLTGAQVEEVIRAHLAAVDVTGAIIRQVVVNCSHSVRAGIDQPGLARLTGSALMWTLELRRPDADADPGRTGDGLSMSLSTAGSADLPRLFRGWVSEWAGETGLAENLRPVVIAEGERLLRATASEADTDSPAAVPPNPAVLLTTGNPR